jgi:SSS family solute:Na+ symporter
MFLAAEVGALHLDLSPIDLVLMLIYFSFVLGIGFALKRGVKSSLDFFLSGRSLPAWVTGIGFISANIGAVELLGQSASGTARRWCTTSGSARFRPWCFSGSS